MTSRAPVIPCPTCGTPSEGRACLTCGQAPSHAGLKLTIFALAALVLAAFLMLLR